MSDNAKSMVLASFTGDSLALGVHWIYDQGLIARTHGRLGSLLAPGSGSYHPNKRAGQLTHYGDQALVLLASLAQAKGFSPEDFSARWKSLFENYTGYVDRASRATLERLAQGWGPGDAGSGSDELAGVSRMAPLAYLYQGDLEAMVAAARKQTAMTHRSAMVVDAAEFFARTVHAVLAGAEPAEAMAESVKGRFPGSPLPQWVEDGLAAKDEDSVAAIAQFGQSCHAEGAFTSVVQLIAGHQDDLATALVDSAMAGGDSAARNMLVGMVLGARLGHGGDSREVAGGPGSQGTHRRTADFPGLTGALKRY